MQCGSIEQAGVIGTRESRTRNTAYVGPGVPGAAALGLDPFPAVAERIGHRRLAQITWGLIAIGLAARLLRYLLRFPLWPDEAFLAHSLLDRGYLDLLQPLDFRQVAPLLYLWVQLTFVKCMGFSEYSLRLFALLSGIGSLFLFRHLAGQLLRGTALALGTSIFAVAYPLIRYSAEAKPYGSDVLASLIVLTLAVRWRRSPQDRRWWWALGLAMPLAVMLSYPAVFVAGGTSATMALVLWRRGVWRDWLGWVLCNLALLAGFAALVAFSAGNQVAATAGSMRSEWGHTFPPLHSPSDLAVFLLVSHTSDAMSYPLGGPNGASAVTALCCAIALVLLVRARRFCLLGLCLFPLALNFVAAALHYYPYGGHARLALYMGPIVCLLMGLGGARALDAMKTRWSLTAGLKITLAVLAAIGMSSAARDLLRPYKEPCWMRQRDFARWFWVDKAIDGELICVRNDLEEPFFSPWEGDGLASVYYCNQRIYSPRHARRERARLDEVPPGRPLRCVRYRPASTPDDQEAAFRDWLKEMQTRYQLVATERHPQPFVFKEREIVYVDQVEVYDFVPK